MKYLSVVYNYTTMKKSDLEMIINILGKKYPKRKTNLREPFQSLIKTILSQRTRDESTDIAANKLFSIFKTPLDLANADINEIEKLIKVAGFYRQKAKRIKEVSQIILSRYNAKVPESIDELITLPGVGRKTANCVLVYGFGKPAIPVDTHVHRISNRLGIVNTKTPEETEKELMEIIQQKYWININDILVRFGQEICRPIGPKCERCPIFEFCSYSNK